MPPWLSIVYIDCPDSRIVILVGERCLCPPTVTPVSFA